MTSPAEVSHPLFARFFDRVAGKDEERGQATLRRELLGGLAGRVIEVGAGNGLNFPHYPRAVDELVAVEPEVHLRRKAELAAAAAAVPTRVVAGTADDLPAADGSVDAVVMSGVLCSVPDQRSALDEAARVLRTGGELRFYEHVRPERVRGRAHDLIDAAWARAMGGCHVNRRTVVAIEQAGYEVTAVRTFTFPAGARLSPVARKAIGAARRPR
jgi:ubiquinone/menaquinone biosynthesis C-methylase UbiE